MIKVNNISFRYKKNSPLIFDSLSFEVNDKECLVILGKNGVGKSTLIKCLLGLKNVTSGEILVDNQNINEIKNNEKAKLFALVPQLIEGSDLSVYETLLLGRLPYFDIYPRKEDYEIVSKYMDKFELNNIALKSMNEISGGERQKVIITKALIQDAKTIIFDEPTSNLDIKNQISVLDTIKQIKKDKGAIISMHDINMALDVGDKFILLKDGKILASGDSSILTKELLEECYETKFNILEINGRKYVNYEKN